jgi:hypothetical protein
MAKKLTGISFMTKLSTNAQHWLAEIWAFEKVLR